MNLQTITISEDKIYLGVSSCLIGEKVRYDGTHKHDHYITEVLSEYFELVPFCPEVAIGLGIPRPGIHLETINKSTRAIITEENNKDVTEVLDQYGKAVLKQHEFISGYVFKSRSPSCGINNVKLYDEEGNLNGSGSGVYARSIIEAQPHLPVTEEGLLNDPQQRDNFMIRVNLHHQWQYMKSNGITAASLNTFHSENKFLISAHDQQVLHQLEQLFQNEKNSITALINLYKEIMLSALNKLAHKDYLINALNLITEFLADKIETDSDKDLLGSIDSYQNNIVPVIAPLIQIHQLFSKIRVEVL